MRVAEEIVAKARNLTQKSGLPWSYVHSDTLLCLGLTTNPDKTGLTITPLTDDASYQVHVQAAAELTNIYWLNIKQPQGSVLYQWVEPHYGMSFDFLGCTIIDGHCARLANNTNDYLLRRKSTLRALIQTGMPGSVITKAIHGAGFRYAAEAIHLTAALMTAHDDSKGPFHMACLRLWERRENMSDLRAELANSGLADHADKHLRNLVKGVWFLTRPDPQTQ